MQKIEFFNLKETRLKVSMTFRPSKFKHGAYRTWDNGVIWCFFGIFDFNLSDHVIQINDFFDQSPLIGHLMVLIFDCIFENFKFRLFIINFAFEFLFSRCINLIFNFRTSTIWFYAWSPTHIYAVSLPHDLSVWVAYALPTHTLSDLRFKIMREIVRISYWVLVLVNFWGIKFIWIVILLE